MNPDKPRIDEYRRVDNYAKSIFDKLYRGYFS